MIWGASDGVWVPGVHLKGGKEERMSRVWKWLFSLNFERNFTASFLKLLFIWNPICSFLMSLIYEKGSFQSMGFRWGWSFLEATIIGLFAMLVIWIYLLVEKIWYGRYGKSRTIHGTGWFLLFMALLVPPGLYLALRLIVYLINWTFVGDPITPEFHWEYYGSETFWGWMLLLVFFFIKSWEELRDAARSSRLRAEELEKERLQALLTKLKDQMNPHFLFNTLNTVASLIPEDPAKAEQVVIKLSSLFQAVLEATRRTNHSLKKELDFCRDYLDIEKSRFGTRLISRIKIAEGLDVEKIQVPVLILQPLVENAVKHGISSRAGGGHIWVSATEENRWLILSVEDDGIGFGNSPYAGSGTALENCRKRLDLEFGAEGRLDVGSGKKGGARLVITLPLDKAMMLEKGKE